MDTSKEWQFNRFVVISPISDDNKDSKSARSKKRKKKKTYKVLVKDEGMRSYADDVARFLLKTNPDLETEIKKQHQT